VGVDWASEAPTPSSFVGHPSHGGDLAASIKKSYNRRETVDKRILKKNEINLPNYFYK
jgi:hypothetical protein